MKYAALLLNGFAILLLGWVIFDMAQLAQTRQKPGLRPVVMELAPLPTALQGDQAQMVEAIGAMSRLQTQTFKPDPAMQQLLAVPAPGVALADSIQMPARSMSVHLENLATNAPASVVIDGRLVRHGTPLGGGGRVAEVRPNGTVVIEKLGRQTLSLPLSQLRVGTLRWADGTPASISTQQFRSGVAGDPAPQKINP